jgi:hypothetical protein
VQLVGSHVRVAADGGEVGVTEVRRYEASIARLLTEPHGSRVPQCVGSDPLLEPGSLGGATDDGGEDRRLQSPAGSRKAGASAGRGVGRGAPSSADEFELASERGRERLTPRLAALAAPHEQRRSRSVELEVAPAQRDEPGSPQSCLDEGQ